MAVKPKKRWFGSTPVRAALAAAVVLLIVLAGLRTYGPRTTKEFPRPPLPKAFPDCPKIETKAHSWRGLSFLAPAHWEVEEDEVDYPSTPGDRMLMVFSADKNTMRAAAQSTGIMEHKHAADVVAQAVEAAWALPEGEALEPADFEMLGPTTVRSSMQRLKVSGYKAFLSLDRGPGVLPRENDSWHLLISDHGRTLSMGSGALFNPYKWTDDGLIRLDEREVQRSEEAACGFWTVVRSLKISK